MSSLPFLTSELQALSKEAGRKHADVKEAADKALALLKSSPESALSDLHDGSTSSPGKHPILLAPIVLGCSTKNPKVTSIAVSGLQRLTGVRGAITENTVPIILTTLRSVLSQGVEIQLKILQTLVSLLTNCKDVHDDLLAETLLISFKLLESKIGVVSSTAAATLRQLVMFVFENVDAEDGAAQKAKEDPSAPNFSVSIPQATSDPNSTATTEPHYLLPAARDAYLVFEDICLLVNGEQPSFLKLQNLPRTFGLELIESVLSDFSNVFVSHPELLHLLRTLLSPLLIRALAEKPTFSTTLRLMRVMYLLLKKFNDHLVMESEIFLCMFVKVVAPGETEGSGGHPLSSGMLPTLSKDGKGGNAHTSSSGSSPHWMRVLALEILRGLCGDFELLSKIWSRYDAPHDKGSAQTASSYLPRNLGESTKVPVFTSMITALNKLATERPALLGTGTAVLSGVVADPHTGEYSVSGVVDGIVGMAHQAATSVGVAGPSQGGLTMATATVKLQCIDQLDKSDAPAIPETYVFLLALQCLNAIAEGFAAHILPLYNSIMGRRPRQGTSPLPAPPAIDFSSGLQLESDHNTLKTAYDMAEAAWPALLASLSFFITTNLDDELFTYTLSAFQQFNTTCGVLGLNTPRDAFLISLCKFAVPPPIISNLASTETAPSTSSRPQLNSMLSAGADALGLSAQPAQPMSLSTRNLLCLRSLIHVAQALAGSLEKTWFYVFEALQNADLVVRTEASRRQKKRSHPPTTTVAHASQSKTVPSVQGSSAGGAGSHSTTASRFVPSDQEEQAAHARAARLFETSKVLDDSGFQWFVVALCRLNAEMIGIPTSELGELVTPDPGGTPTIVKEGGQDDGEASAKQPKRSGINVIRTLRPGEKSYAVTKLGDVSILNMDRLTTRSAALGWDIVTGHLLLVQHWQNAPNIVRLQAAEIFDKIVSAAPKECPDAPEETHKHVQDQVLKALAKQVEPYNRSQTSADVEIRQAGLDTLYKILESQGHALLCGWSIIFEMLQTACPDGGNAIPIATSSETSAATTAKMSQLVRVAFPSLQLICSDFLAALSAEECGLGITTLSAFGRQKADVNVALTAGNLLWQVSDHLQVARRQAKESETYLNLWMDLLHELLELCRDPRQEVRDGAIQILWRSIELYGATLNEQSWQKCISGVIFPLLASLNEGLLATEQEDLPDNVEKTALGVPLPYKQWDDSKILAVTSAGNVFFNELSSDIAKLPSFEQVCVEYVRYMQATFLNDRPAVATAAAKALERVTSIQWTASQSWQAQHVATTVWQAWLEIGHAIEEEKHGLTQQNLEYYLKIITMVQERKFLIFTDERTFALLGTLKCVLTYPFSPDYRPDQDVMPAVQALVVTVLDHVDLASNKVVSAVLHDLAEYMTLAYTTLSETVKSPTLTDRPRLNQKVTYIALSKNCTGRILDIYQRFKDEPDIYETAVESVLAAYAVPLRLKYECPLPSKFGDDAPLWKTATQHFLQLARSIVQSLQKLAPSLSGETKANVWRQLLAGFRAVLQADCRSAMDMSLDDQRMEEDFDLAVIVTLETDILPSLGNSAVPIDVITSLARALRDSSRLHEVAGGYSSSNLLSPSLTAVSSRESAASSSRSGPGSKTSGYGSQANSETTLDGTTMEDEELPRERFAYWCLDLLFLMCSSAHEEDAAGRKKIAVLTFPLLFDRCLSVLRLYLADSAVRGKVPFTRIREEELVYILENLRTLELDEGVFEAAFAKHNPVKALQEIEDGGRPPSSLSSAADLLAFASRRSSRAHLYELYPQLLALITLPRLVNNITRHTVPYASLTFPSGQAPANKEDPANLSARSRVDKESVSSQILDAKALAGKCLAVVGEGFSVHT